MSCTCNDYQPLCKRCGDTNDIGHEPGAFTDALGYGPNCPDCKGKNYDRLRAWQKEHPRAMYTTPSWTTFWPEEKSYYG